MYPFTLSPCLLCKNYEFSHNRNKASYSVPSSNSSLPQPISLRGEVSMSQELSSCPSPGSATGETGGQETQVGADSLINTVLLGCLRGPRCCWQVLNGRTERDMTSARWRLILREIIEELRVDYMISRSKCGCLIFLLSPPCNQLLSVAVMNAWLKMRLLPGWKPLSDLVFVLTCSTHSRLVLCGQSQPSTPTPITPVSLFQAFKRTSLFCLTLHHLLSRGHFTPLFLLFNLPVHCPWQPLWKLIFLSSEALNLNLSSGVIVHLCLFPYDVSVFHFH